MTRDAERSGPAVRTAMMVACLFFFSVVVEHVPRCSAFPQQPGSCNGGGGVSSPHSAIALGDVDEGGYELLIDGRPWSGGDDAGSVLSLDASKKHSWEIRVADDAVESGFLGFLLRVSEINGADVTGALSLDDESQTLAKVFDSTTTPVMCDAGVVAAGHATQGDDKISVKGSFDFDAAEDADVELELTIVAANNGLENRWYFSKYLLEVRREADASPKPSASSVPTPGPTTTPSPTSAPTGSSSPLCSQELRLRSDLIFSHGTYIDSNDRMVWQGKLVYDKPAWLAVAVAKGSTGMMLGGEAIVGLPDLGSTPGNPSLYDLNGYDISKVNRKEAGLQKLFDHSVEQTDDGTTTLSFSRYVEESGIMSMSTDGPTAILYAGGTDNEWKVHAITGSFRIDLGELCDEDGDESDESDENKKNTVILLTDGKETMWQIHGMFAGLAWGVATPVAVASSMVRDAFSCGKGTWFKVHMWLNLVSVVFTATCFAVAVRTFEETGREHFASSKPHHVIGLVVFVLASAQVIGGLLRPHIDHGETPVSTRRRAWKYGHRITGVALLGMGIYQIFSGFGLYAEKYNVPNYSWTFGVWLGIMVLVVVAKKMMSKIREPEHIEDHEITKEVPRPV